MSKTILFDCWGTLIEQGVHSPLKQVKEILGIKIPFSHYVVRAERVMMTHAFPTLKEAFLAIAKEFNLQPTEEQLDALIGMWNKSWMLAKPYEEVEEVLRELQKNYVLALVSNTDNIGVEKVLEKFGLKSYFAATFYSYQLGNLKTDRNFFYQVFDQLGVEAEDCTMVGDSIQSDIIPTKQLGMQAVLIDRKDQRDFPGKIKDLRELEGVL
ncbi:HAD family hydrolase [Candidatus Woesearchaeota archaeon]|nr:HAD family hydrolase [Candidatus Woesearchaeota archaeon]